MKKLVVFGGPPCTGKSTIGRALGYAHLEMDAARAALLPDSAHTRADRAVAYRAILWTAGLLLRYTDIVICDGGFGHPEDRDGCRTAARQAGAALYVVTFSAPLDVLIERNRLRRGHHPGLDLTDARVTELVATYRPWVGGITIDGTQAEERILAAVRGYLKTEGMSAQ